MIFWLLLGVILPAAGTALWLPFNAWFLWRVTRRRYDRRRFAADWFWTGLIQGAIWAIAHPSYWLPVMTGAVISSLIAAAVWWRRRRKRRRALALLGAKSKAVIAAMVRTMRERKPSRVLRPHPVPS